MDEIKQATWISNNIHSVAKGIFQRIWLVKDPWSADTSTVI